LIILFNWKMKKIFILIVVITTSFISFGQNKCDTSEYYAQNAQFFFNTFQKGTVVFNDETKVDAILNYNVVSNDVYYIDENKYFSLNRENVKYVAICDYRFYFENGKVLQLIFDKGVQLLVERNVNMEEFYDKKGAYGATSPNTVGTDFLDVTLSNLPEDRSYLVNLRDKEDKEINVVINYKIKYGKKFYPATQKSFLKIYSENKDKLKKYFSENNFDFKNKQDLIQIANYCISL